MTNGTSPLPDDFFRARPQRSELHRFLSEAHLEGMIADVRETQIAVSAKTEAFLEKATPLLHIAHPRPEPPAAPVARSPEVIRLHIPHDPLASRLSRRVHIDHERGAAIVSPPPQSLAQQTAATDLLLADTFIAPAASPLPPTIELASAGQPKSRPRPRACRAPVLPIGGVQTALPSTRRQAMSPLAILVPDFSVVAARPLPALAITVPSRRLAKVRRMPRVPVVGIASSGKGKKMPVAAIAAAKVSSARLRVKKAKPARIRVLKKRLATSVRMLPQAIAPIVLPARLPHSRMLLFRVSRVKPLRLPQSRAPVSAVVMPRSVAAIPVKAAALLPIVLPSRAIRKVPVAITRPTRSKTLPVTQNVASLQFRSVDSAAVFQEIIAGVRVQVKGLSRLRKPVAPKVELTIPQAPHTHQKALRQRFAFIHRTRAPRPPKAVRPASFLREAARFAMTSAAIFAISFSVMNAQALGQLLMARINPEEAAVKKIALEKVTDTEVKNLAPILPTAGMKRESHKVYPPLRIKPAPLENRIVIPKIGKNIPIVGVGGDSLVRSDWGQLEKDIQNALKDGVVHYPGTAEPGQLGNVFVTGHSSYYLWDGGRFKDVFARLHDLDAGDEFTIFWEQNVYRYKIRERKVVSPEETSVLKQPQDEKIATLMTCTPIGTAKNRLILVAEQL